MIQENLNQIRENFIACLHAKREDELELNLRDLRYSLKKLETYDSYELEFNLKKQVRLFIEIFQFSLLARDGVWTEIPKVHRAIGEIIHLRQDYEVNYRRNIRNQKLGMLLEFIND